MRLLRWLTVALALGSAAAWKNPCDDGMGGRPGNLTLHALNDVPDWVVAPINRTMHTPAHIVELMNWPRRKKPRKCTLKGYGFQRVCVPKGGKKGAFRAKIRVKTSCGIMHVKYRVSSKGRVVLWGRNAS